jgi:hypothetical protein
VRDSRKFADFFNTLGYKTLSFRTWIGFRSAANSGRGRDPALKGTFVKGCRTPAVTGWLRRARTAGVRQASREETAGRIDAVVLLAMGI